MGRNIVALAFTLLVWLIPTAHAFVSPPTLDPPNPIAGQSISVDIYAGVCDLFTIDPPAITRTGNSIRMVLQSVSAPPASDFCIYPTGTYVFPLGAFPVGSYSLQVDRVYMGFTGGTVTETLGTLSFNVTATPVSGVPTLDSFGTLVLILILLAALIRRDRGQSKLLMLTLSLLIWMPNLHAQQSEVPQNLTIRVLLSTKQGAPTPDDVISYTNGNKGGTPPLQGLGVENPRRARYLLQFRATGDFSAYLQQNPDSARAKLERYLVIAYPEGADMNKALAALKSDSNVAGAYGPLPGLQFSSAQLTGFGVTQSGAAPIYNGPQYGRDDLNTDAAWQIAGGYALIGVVDSGLYTSHSAFTQFTSSGQYLGGNFVPSSSLNIGFEGITGLSSSWSDPDVDEEYPMTLSNGTKLPPSYAGHGTHVVGLIAANPASTLGLKGTCLHCGIGMWKVTYVTYSQLKQQALPVLNTDAFNEAIVDLSDSGAQVINLSVGGSPQVTNYCSTATTDSLCLALTHASTRDATLVAAAGNNRTSIDFPASDSRVLDVGGFDQQLAIWDLSPPPPNTTNCPPSSLTNEPVGHECGSNYTLSSGYPRQELMASANLVLSTTYPNLNWNNIGCGDGYPGPGWGNGKGLCTGTSMSAPQISGVVGILRSINPLVLTGLPVPGTGQAAGIRTVLANTTFEAQAGSGWSQTFGYGHPDAAAAALTMLGTVAGRRVLNRVTPLFRLYSSVGDYADTTSPQFATALMINQPNAYQPQGAFTPGYSSFPPTLAGETSLPAPRAAIYILTTEHTPWPNYPALLPLYLLDCIPGFPAAPVPTCTKSHRDFMLATTIADVQTAHQNGYSLRTIQGYIYKACSPSDCMPPGAQKLYRECKTSLGDCAAFLESERVTFEAAGYTAAYPAGSNKVLGYAYPNIDSDNDGLVDGMEYVIGTNQNNAHSDGNAAHPVDGITYPQAGVPLGDPCLGPSAYACPADSIFKNGFQ